MGISGDYVDSTFEHRIHIRPPDSPVGYEPRQPTPKPSMSVGRSMLPVPKDSVAPQECVKEDRVGKPEDEDNQISERTDGKVGEVAGHSKGKQRKRAPLRYVREEHWSPGIYRLLRLCRHPLEVAWERAFAPLPTF